MVLLAYFVVDDGATSQLKRASQAIILIYLDYFDGNIDIFHIIHVCDK